MLKWTAGLGFAISLCAILISKENHSLNISRHIASETEVKDEKATKNKEVVAQKQEIAKLKDKLCKQQFKLTSLKEEITLAIQENMSLLQSLDFNSQRDKSEENEFYNKLKIVTPRLFVPKFQFQHAFMPQRSLYSPYRLRRAAPSLFRAPVFSPGISLSNNELDFTTRKFNASSQSYRPELIYSMPRFRRTTLEENAIKLF